MQSKQMLNNTMAHCLTLINNSEDLVNEVSLTQYSINITFRTNQEKIEVTISKSGGSDNYNLRVHRIVGQMGYECRDLGIDATLLTYQYPYDFMVTLAEHMRWIGDTISGVDVCADELMLIAQQLKN